MLLTIDIGNTNIVFGCFEGERLLFDFRVKTDTGRTTDEYAVLLMTLLQSQLGSSPTISRCVLSSVVPPLTPDISEVVRSRFGIAPIIVGPGVKTGIGLKVAEPNAVGADRIVNLVAAKALFGSPALVIDFGTATTFDYLSKEGNYEGGAIVPGVGVATESLVRNTAKLPRVEIRWPESAIGKTTVTQMQSGAVIGYACLIEGMIDRILGEAGPVSHIIATGGLGQLFSEKCKKISHYDPHLTLKGMQIISTMN